MPSSQITSTLKSHRAELVTTCTACNCLATPPTSILLHRKEEASAYPEPRDETYLPSLIPSPSARGQLSGHGRHTGILIHHSRQSGNPLPGGGPCTTALLIVPLAFNQTRYDLPENPPEVQLSDRNMSFSRERPQVKATPSFTLCCGLRSTYSS